MDGIEIDAESVRRRQRQNAVEWVAVFAVAAVVGAVVTRRPLPWLVGGVGAAALAILRSYVLGQWLLGRIKGWVALVLHLALAAVGALGLWALASSAG